MVFCEKAPLREFFIGFVISHNPIPKKEELKADEVMPDTETKKETALEPPASVYIKKETNAATQSESSTRSCPSRL